MPVTERQRRPGQRDVDALGGERGGQRGAAQLGFALGDEALELGAHDVAQLADHRPLGDRQRGDRTQDLGEPALAAQELHAHVLDGVGAGRARGRGRSLGEQRGELGRAFLQVVQLGVVHGHSFRGASPPDAGSSGSAARDALAPPGYAGLAARRESSYSAMAPATPAFRDSTPATGGPGQRDGDEVGDAGKRVGGQAGALGAHDEQYGAVGRRTLCRWIGRLPAALLEAVERRAAVGDEAVHGAGAELFDGLRERHVLIERQLEHGPHAGAHHLGREQVDRAG